MLPEHSSKALADAWGPKFEAKDIDMEAADQFIARHALDLSEINFEVEFQAFSQMIVKHKWSSPGSDGFHYVFWATETGTMILWNICIFPGSVRICWIINALSRRIRITLG